MKRVYKYEVRCSIDLPAGAEVVHVAVQSGVAYLWALVDPSAPLVTRTFRVAGTGRDVDEAHAHVGSWLDGPFAWHLFEIGASA